MSFLSFTRARISKVRAEGNGAAINSQTVSQPALKGLGPEAGDPFRFTWWTTTIGAGVWIEHRGRWRAGTVASCERKYVEVEIEGRGSRRLDVRTSYSELRRRR